ncbi:hypothetical protein SEPCBS57363_006016 [Sporothrix epigloea]|uniref:Carboxylic ester hydrolase n=1 Tax=Sporothrix epigloea TaxID=1892477 RepID=A0ABP0E4T5_9PEZI
MALVHFIVAVMALVGSVAAVTIPEPQPVIKERAGTSVTIVLPIGTVIGASSGGVESYNSIPFAEPPTGNLRLKPPVRKTTFFGVRDGTGPAKACPQFREKSVIQTPFDPMVPVYYNPFIQIALEQESEDCLTIDVVRPAGTTLADKLPVLYWMYGTGFEMGGSSLYNGSLIVAQSIALGKPIVFVTANYRVGGFGFLPGAEILADGASNLGLLDQRLGLEWTADNIGYFGGDSSKVTIWGESAGAISVLDQMVMYDGNNTYNGNALFHGAIMSSGTITPADPVDCPKGQAIYNQVVSKAGCAGSVDTLACLRSADYSTFLDAVNSVPGVLSYRSLALSYLPRPDGNVLTDSPEVLIGANKYAAVPMIVGDEEDEGTVFSFYLYNITNTDQFVQYLSTYYFNSATTDQIKTLVNTYPVDIPSGSPFRTSYLNEAFPGFKRLAAILGDFAFTLARRVFLTAANKVNPTVPIFRLYPSGLIWAATAMALPFRDIRCYFFNFAYNLDPNSAIGGTSSLASNVTQNWPQWGVNNQLVQFNKLSMNLLADTFRASSYSWISNNIGLLHL